MLHLYTALLTTGQTGSQTEGCAAFIYHTSYYETKGSQTEGCAAFIYHTSYYGTERQSKLKDGLHVYIPHFLLRDRQTIQSEGYSAFIYHTSSAKSTNDWVHGHMVFENICAKAKKFEKPMLPVHMGSR